MENLNSLELPHEALGLGAALAVGLLIGLERGWRDRDLPDGARIAGLRTFALIGLLGGVLGSLLPGFGPWPLLGGVLGLALIVAVSYAQAVKSSGNLSATTAVASLLTLALGAFAVHGSAALALAAAVIVMVLLDLKPALHGGLRLIEHREMRAGLQLLVLSVVILPGLPNRGWGPFDAINPYQLWWAVILIASLSLVGHFAMRLTGAQRGIVWTGLLGGLASSTAATLTLARYTRQNPSLAGAATAGALSACGVMFFRIAVLLAVLRPALLATFGVFLVVTGGVLLGWGLWQGRACARGVEKIGNTDTDATIAPMAPFDLGTALGFGAFLAVMAVMVPLTQQWVGSSGIYLLSAISGIADVDAIVISLANLQGASGLTSDATVVALTIASLANMLTKVTMAWSTGGAAMGRPLLKGYAMSVLAGALALTPFVVYAGF